MSDEKRVGLNFRLRVSASGAASGSGSGYKSCSGAYSRGCQAEAIKKVQGCLGLVTDGKFGPKTEAALKAKGFSSFTDAEVDKICAKTPAQPSDEFTTQVEPDNFDDIINNN